MIRFAFIITVIISIACGSYALTLLARLRRIYRLEFISSFLYYELLKLGFGLSAIFGGLAIKQILLKYELQSGQIESIVIALPFFGVPFIIAAWYLLIKMANELAGKETRQLVSIIYFVLATLSFLAYGLILRASPENRSIDPEKLSQLIRTIFYIIDLLIKVYIALILARQTRYISRMALVFLLISIMSSAALHFAYLHPLIGIYFILLFFAGDLVPVILLRVYLDKHSEELSDVKDSLENLYQKYGISKREREIIAEICQGNTNQQIADKLFISLQTVKDHTHNIFRKVNVSNRVQLSQVFSAAGK